MKYIYTKDYNITYSYVDCACHLGLVEFMNLNQDMITGFCGYIGCDNINLKAKSNAAWVYTRTKVMVMGELPIWNATTRAVTYISSRNAIRLELQTDLYDENDNLLVVAKTEMCAIDLTSRRIRKIETIEFPEDLEAPEITRTDTFSKMNTEFESSEMVYSQKVFASDIDFTHHTNNVKYVKYVMNTFGSEFYDKKTFSEFEIQFAKESKEGDTLDIFKKKTDNSEYCFAIKNEDDIVIRAKICFKEKVMLKDHISSYYFEQNYNCAETILRAANDYYNLQLHDRDMILVGAYGAGVQAGNTCGAILAAAAVLSMKYVEAKAHESEDIRPVVQKLLRKFNAKYNSTLCKDIKPQSFKPEYRCRMTVETACDILEETIEEYEAEKNK